MLNILVVCTGNTCRSPFAAAYFNKRFAELGMEAKAQSAGLFVMKSQFPCEAALTAATFFGVGEEMKNHISVNITDVDIRNADYVFAVTQNHYEMLKPKVDLINSSRKDNKITNLYVLGDSIDDPYGQSTEIYKICYNKIVICVDAIIGELRK